MDNPRLVHGNVIPMGIPCETFHGIGWDRHTLLWDGNRTDKYVPWTTLSITFYRTRELLLYFATKNLFTAKTSSASAKIGNATIPESPTKENL